MQKQHLNIEEFLKRKKRIIITKPFETYTYMKYTLMTFVAWLLDI